MLSLTGILGLIGSALGAGASIHNMNAQRDENKITRSREDNAVQRRKADLEAAGLNPALAAGQSASASALNAPQFDANSVIQGLESSSNLVSKSDQHKISENNIKVLEYQAKQAEESYKQTKALNEFAEKIGIPVSYFSALPEAEKHALFIKYGLSSLEDNSPNNMDTPQVGNTVDSNPSIGDNPATKAEISPVTANTEVPVSLKDSIKGKPVLQKATVHEEVTKEDYKPSSKIKDMTAEEIWDKYYQIVNNAFEKSHTYYQFNNKTGKFGLYGSDINKANLIAYIMADCNVSEGEAYDILRACMTYEHNN